MYQIHRFEYDVMLTEYIGSPKIAQTLIFR
jgi:hypothetical protein